MKIPARTPTFIAAICGKQSKPALSRVGAGPAGIHRGEAEKFSFDVLDATKLIPEELVPVTPVGRMVLNRNPDNFFAETEQVAFCTAHIVPGIDFSNDPLLQGRHPLLPGHADLAARGSELPRDADQRTASRRCTTTSATACIARRFRAAGSPTSRTRSAAVVRSRPAWQAFSFPSGRTNARDKVRGKPEKFAEHYNQATLFWDSQSAVEKTHIVGAFRFELSKVTVPAIRRRMLSSLLNVSEELASAVAAGLGSGIARSYAPGRRHGSGSRRSTSCGPYP